jgi:hypothetical protein
VFAVVSRETDHDPLFVGTGGFSLAKACLVHRNALAFRVLQTNTGRWWVSIGLNSRGARPRRDLGGE